MKVHLVDGTYELFRHFFGAPPHRNAAGDEVAAVRGRGRLGAAAAGGGGHPRRAWPPTTSSSPSATTCGPGTRRARASIPTCGPRPGRSRRRSPRWGCWCGRWSSSRRTTPWPAVPPWPTTTRRSSRSSSARRTRTSASACAGTRVVQLDRRKDVLIDEAGVDGQVRGRPGLHPGLPGPRRRQRGRVSRAGGVGSQVGRHRAGPVGPHRGHPAGPR